MQFAVENIRRLFMFTNVINRSFHFFSYKPIMQDAFYLPLV